MYYILAIVIILYAAMHIFLRHNAVFLNLRRWIDIAAGGLAVIILAVSIGVFHYSYFFIIYFLISLAMIIGLTFRLRKAEEKKAKAEETIKVLKDEEQVLQGEVEEEKKDQAPKV